MSRRKPYPPLRPWKWPEPGQRTWLPKNPDGTYVYAPCTGAETCRCKGCPVGVYAIGGKIHGCDCKGHDARRERLRLLLENGG